MEVDVAVLGAGFAGSLTALLLERIGLRAVLIDRGVHPRFAIGESTTPSANLVLRDLCATYDLPRVGALAKYGTWKQAHPQIVCGPKRGFSYFQQRPGETYRADRDHSRELLVAASSTLSTADTHWLRSDVDRFLVEEAVRAKIPYVDRLAVNIVPEAHHFRLTGDRLGQAVTIDAKFLIDGTGEAGLVLKTFGIPQRLGSLLTNSRAIFGHFTNLSPWRSTLEVDQGAVADHPFDCDQSALHQVLDEGWMWQLRFDNGVTSAGFALDGNRDPLPENLSPQQEWSRLMDRYPSLAEQFASTQLVAPAGGLFRSQRMQRRAEQAAGNQWAALPHTAGFIDPLHSTGIAHSICGIEKLVAILREHWDRPSLRTALERYETAVLNEIDVIDGIVGSCYLSLGCFEAFAACCMLYFAAATTFERRRLESSSTHSSDFLCANDHYLQRIIQSTKERLLPLRTDSRPERAGEFRRWLQQELAPFNHVGLFTPDVPNMYWHTAVPAEGSS